MYNKMHSTCLTYLDKFCPRKPRLSDEQLVGHIFDIFKILDSANTQEAWHTAKENIVQLLIANGRDVTNIDTPYFDHTSIEDLAQHMQALELTDTPPITLWQSLFPCLDCSDPLPKPRLYRTTAQGTIVDSIGTPLALTMRAFEKFEKSQCLDWTHSNPTQNEFAITQEPEPILSAEVQPAKLKSNLKIITEQPTDLHGNMLLTEGSPVSVAGHPSL